MAKKKVKKDSAALLKKASLLIDRLNREVMARDKEIKRLRDDSASDLTQAKEDLVTAALQKYSVFAKSGEIPSDTTRAVWDKNLDDAVSRVKELL